MPVPHVSHHGRNSDESGQRPGGGPAGPLLYTPAQAAALLQVRESWLRRNAGNRSIPCTFLGRHLRFSPTDLAAIVADASAATADRRRTRRYRHTRRTIRRTDLMPRGESSGDPPRPDDHKRREGSSTWPG